ncbi:PREDICTED: zinc transporter ZIP1-like [Thamnophis sirtalis]|uniref:Zinc transporter ZIP1-like n=1 Tax=Thamnophis sirtalis TaxID=35019 RepID=A0A6I9XU60_9SAUR|nr:PREDICTED: zinc transporter ZIP1-like [Thamnophis sirtalis]
MWSLQALKLGCLLALATLPLLCGLLPALLFRLRASRSGRSILSCAAGGVFMAACLLDVVPDSLADLRDELRRQSISPAFPAPELVLALGFLLVLVLEHVMLDCSDRPGAESTPLLGRQEAAVVEQRAETVLSPFRSLVLVVSLSLHSAFEGLALGLQDTPSQVLRLAAAIVLHKCIIAASLGLLLLQSRLPLPWLAAVLACFALMSPVGVGVGMAVPRGAGGSLARSVLEGVAAGTFLYITFLEILPQELHLPSGRLPKVLALLLGFSGMAGLRFLG